MLCCPTLEAGGVFCCVYFGEALGLILLGGIEFCVAVVVTAPGLLPPGDARELRGEGDRGGEGLALVEETIDKVLLLSVISSVVIDVGDAVAEVSTELEPEVGKLPSVKTIFGEYGWFTRMAACEKGSPPLSTAAMSNLR